MTTKTPDTILLNIVRNLLIENDADAPGSQVRVKVDAITVEDTIQKLVDLDVNLGISGAGGLDVVPAPALTDNFNRADSDTLGGNWSEVGDAQACAVRSNQLRLIGCVAAGTCDTLGFARDTTVVADDQQSSLIYKSGVGRGRGGPAVRIASGATLASFTGYVANYRQNTTVLELKKYVAQSLITDTGTVLGSVTLTLVDGDRVKCEAVGSGIKVFVNGIEKISVSDSGITGGFVGIVANRIDGGAVVDSWINWEDWEAGATALTSNKWFAVWLIAKGDGAVAGLFSESFTAPTMPAGYDRKRRVGAVRSNLSNTFYKFRQIGDRVYYNDEEVSDSEHRLLNGGAATTFTAVTGATRTAPSTSRRIICRLSYATGTAAAQAVHVRPTGSGWTTGRRVHDRSAVDVVFVTIAEIDVNASQSFDYRLTAAAPTLFIVAHGYYDPVL